MKLKLPTGFWPLGMLNGNRITSRLPCEEFTRLAETRLLEIASITFE